MTENSAVIVMYGEGRQWVLSYIQLTRGDEQLGAHLAHNQEYISSSLIPATLIRVLNIIIGYPYFYMDIREIRH